MVRENNVGGSRMPSSVIITSSNPNNNALQIFVQPMAESGPMGDPVPTALLDDGQSVTLEVTTTSVLVVVEHPRNARVPKAPEAPQADHEEHPRVIGDGIGSDP